MKNEKSLRRKIQYIILIPIILAILLTCVTIYVNGLESKVGTFSLAILVVYIIISIIIYLRMIPSVDSVVLDYSLEQGKIQKLSFIAGADFVIVQKIFVPNICWRKIWHDNVCTCLNAFFATSWVKSSESCGCGKQYIRQQKPDYT